jgi:hypothetical protein
LLGTAWPTSTADLQNQPKLHDLNLQVMTTPTGKPTPQLWYETKKEEKSASLTQSLRLTSPLLAQPAFCLVPVPNQKNNPLGHKAERSYFFIALCKK